MQAVVGIQEGDPSARTSYIRCGRLNLQGRAMACPSPPEAESYACVRPDRAGGPVVVRTDMARRRAGSAR